MIVLYVSKKQSKEFITIWLCGNLIRPSLHLMFNIMHNNIAL